MVCAAAAIRVGSLVAPNAITAEHGSGLGRIALGPKSL
jgi:hypothetical protein